MSELWVWRRFVCKKYTPLSDLRGQSGGHAYISSHSQRQPTGQYISKAPTGSSDNVQARRGLYVDPPQ